MYCVATGCATQPAFTKVNVSVVYAACIAHTNTISGFVATSVNTTYVRCLAYGNSGAASDGFAVDNNAVHLNCVAYANGRDGYRANDDQVLYTNCIAEGNGTTAGWGWTNTFGAVFLFNCAGFNNQAGNTSLGTVIGVKNINFVTGSATFFTNAAGADFSLNTTAGGGAAARAAGIPGAFPAGATTGFLDIGAAQHADPAGGGGGGSVFGSHGGVVT